MEKPILFSTAMVQAILEDRKTQTRRVVKPQPVMYDFGPGGISLAWVSPTTVDGYDAVGVNRVQETPGYLKCPYGKPGDILWVRETWKYYEKAVGKGESFHIKKFLAYKADEDNNNIQKSCEWFEGKWHPSIHMPREVARLFLTVKSIRVERLQDITEEDAKAEGIKSYWSKPHENDSPFIGAAKEMGADLCFTRREAFQQLWDFLNAKRGYGWDTNPWVWVIEFERKVAQ